MRLLRWLWKQIETGAVYSDPEAYAIVHKIEGEQHGTTER